MRMRTFSIRCAKEILRDPLNIVFGLGFPIVLLILLSMIQANIPVPLFEIQKLAPGVCVFGLSFIALFSATLIARDRETALLQRLYTTPLRATDYILGYMLPLIPIAMVQGAITYLVAIILGLETTPNIIISILLMTPVSVLYIGIGLLCGSVFNVKQVGGICGALLTNLSAWLSGVWFDIEMVGSIFRKTANLLPFLHSVEMQRAAISGNLHQVALHLPIIFIYCTLIIIAAIYAFLRQMKKQ